MAENKPAKRPAKPYRSHESGPWLPPPWELADASALQALARGDADGPTQKRAIKWIIENACGTYDMSFRPGGEDGRRDTDFAEGRRFAGNQIVKLLKANLGVLRRTENG